MSGAREARKTAGEVAWLTREERGAIASIRFVFWHELFCEPFAEELTIPRKERAGALKAVVQRYAARLEHYARLAPDNWFNFYDVWQSDPP